MSLPGTTMIYAVYWPERNVLKVGRAWKMSRLRGLMETGGRVLLLMRDCPLWEEQAALSELRLTFVRAFATEQEGSSILPRGRGFTECFRVAVADLEHAVKTIFRGIARHDYQLNAASAAGHSDRAASEHVACGSALDRDRVADVRRRSRSGGSRPTSVAVSDLARRSTHHDVNGGGSRLGAGRGGVCRNLRRGGETLFALARWGKVSHADPSYYPPPPPEAFQNISRFALDRFPAVEREGRVRAGVRARARVWVWGLPVSIQIYSRPHSVQSILWELRKIAETVAPPAFV